MNFQKHFSLKPLLTESDVWLSFFKIRFYNPWPATESQFRSRDEPLGWDEIVQTVREQVRQEMRRMQQNNCT